jgi:tRNA-specific 2-thiouridylase
MFAEYEKGRTPNPDVLCNREVKFDVFLKKALEMGAYFVATGHYCRKDVVMIEGKPVYRLLAGNDKNKDQSYFLCQLSQQQLERALFPVGDMEKPEVREIASEIRVASARKKDSQGICFVGKVELPIFLQQKLKAKQGKIIKIDPEKISNTLPSPKTDFELFLQNAVQPYDLNETDGEEIATHSGAHFYTIGQRKGLGIGGLKQPPFVIGIDVEKNIVYIGEGQNHPALYRKGLFVRNEELHYIRPDLELQNGENAQCLCRIRYRQELQKAVIYKRSDGLYVIFENLQRGITGGQFAAFYFDDELFASGVISE